MPENSPAIEIIRRALIFYSLVSEMYFFDKGEINKTREKIDQILKIDPQVELEKAVKSLNAAAARERKAVKSLNESAARERAAQKADNSAAILAQYEQEMLPMDPENKPKRRGRGRK
jgi:serine phosphatase RsbU (regulator of sigma subunit)